ncbi:rhomboid family intramembrane serine protease [Dactylosporangium sp. NPDC005572]|uniref:rhomboid family intramembrane serine protease n=1 Tax=Dactylosporangium sp. NPDC005572 TaxID=3156889 RepID=UPI0033BFB1AA
MTQPPANVVPVCYRHPNRETYVRCTRCDRPICPDCMNEASVGFQCPDCVREGSRSQRPVRTAFGGGTSGAQGTVTIALIVINVLVFVASVISSGRADALAGGGLGGLFGGSTPLHEWGGLLAYPQGRLTDGSGTVVRLAGDGVANGQYYRLFTSMFLHYGILHLAMNMWALWVLGRPLEAILGRVRFLTLYLLSGLAGSISVYLFSAPNALTAGASGAIFGLFAALIVVLRKMGRSIAGILPVLVLNLVITFSFAGAISWQGHLGGLVGGALVAAGLAYAPAKNRTLIQVLASVAIVVLLGVLFAVHTASLPPVYG